MLFIVNNFNERKENKMKRITKEFVKDENKGITLIALVITIIVLLILAGVTIATLTGDNGILTRTEQAKKATGEAGAKEKVQVEALGSFDQYGNFDMNKLKGNLKSNLGLQDKDISDNGDGSILVTVDGYDVKVDKIGNVTIVDDDEITLAVTDIYVTLYTDGTLGFSNNSEPISEKEVSKTYENIKGKNFAVNWDDFTVNTPWAGEAESIKILEISNEIVPTNMEGWFFGFTELTEIRNLTNLRTGNVTSMSGLFAGCLKLSNLDLSNFNTSKVTDMQRMFYSCLSLKNLDLSNFDTSNVTNMRWMFGCNDANEMILEEIKFSPKFNTKNVTDMESMFYNCIHLKSLDLRSFVTDKVENMSWMVACRGGKQMRLETLLLSSKFTTQNVTNMNSMFFSCTNLKNLDVSSFNTSKVEDMGWMFYGCENLTELDLSNFNTENVSNMEYMFCFCKNLDTLDLSVFNTNKVSTMEGMFYSCELLTTIFVGGNWKINQGTNVQDMYTDCGTDETTLI